MLIVFVMNLIFFFVKCQTFSKQQIKLNISIKNVDSKKTIYKISLDYYLVIMFLTIVSVAFVMSI